MNTERLLILADFLEKVVFATMPHRFYYANWLGKDWKGMQDLSCGTTACAAGWVPQIPEFKQFELFYDSITLNHRDVQICSKTLGGPMNPGTTTTEATLTCLFDLDDEGSRAFWYLFFPSEYPPERLAAYLRSGDYNDDLDRCEQAWDKSGFSPPTYASALDVANHIRRYVRAWTRDNE